MHNELGFLRSALVCDILDALGLHFQAFRPDIAALEQGTRLIGRAFTVSAMEVDEEPAMRYVGLLKALDAVTAGDVVVLASGRTERSAMWGELLSNSCSTRGALGTVTDGYARDTAQTRELGYPLFARGSLPLDIHGRCEVVGHGQPVVIDQVVISPGDLIVADDDGVAVVPATIVSSVVEQAAIKADGENSFRDAVRGGLSASEAFDRFGVL